MNDFFLTAKNKTFLIVPYVSVSSFLLHRQDLEDEMTIMNERVQKLGETKCLKCPIHMSRVPPIPGPGLPILLL